MTGNLAAVAERVRSIQARMAALQTSPQVSRSGSSLPDESTNVRASAVPGRTAPNPAFAKILQAEIARNYSVLPSSALGSAEQGGLLGSGLAGLLGFGSGAGQSSLLSTILGAGPALTGPTLPIYGSLNPAQFSLGSLGGVLAASTGSRAGAVGGAYKYNPFGDLEVTSPFGPRYWGGYREQHNGTDYAVKEGTPLPAIGPGKVLSVGEDSVFGRNLAYALDSGEEIRYAHLTEKVPFLVAEGQRVLPGDIVGISGSTGQSTGPHLHIAVKIGGAFVDPEAYLKALP